MKKLAIALSIFPGILLVIALVSYVICFYAERDLPQGGVNIGLCLILLAALINIPTVVAWLIFLARKRGEGDQTSDGDHKRKGMIWVFVGSCLATAVAIGILFSEAFAAYARTHGPQDVNRVSSIGEWEKRTRLPGFTLLDRVDLEGYYICVYDTGSGEIALCYNQKKSESADVHAFAVYDLHGRNLQDPARWNKTSELNKPGDASLLTGMVVPVRPDHRGAVHVEFKADSGSGFQSIYQKRLAHDRDSEGGAGQPATAPDSKPEDDSETEPEPEGRSW